MNIQTIENFEEQCIELKYGDVVVGRIDYEMEDGLMDYKFIYVHPDYRGQGISLQLTDIAYNHSKVHGCACKVSCRVLRTLLKDNKQFDDFYWY